MAALMDGVLAQMNYEGVSSTIQRRYIEWTRRPDVAQWIRSDQPDATEIRARFEYSDTTTPASANVAYSDNRSPAATAEVRSV